MKKISGPAWAWLVGGIVSTLLGAIPSAVAGEVTAVVQEATGIVSVTKNGGKRMIAAQGTTLEVGDTIFTEKDSEARLHFTDGGQIALRPRSALNIQNYRFVEAEPAKDSLVMNLLKGGLRNVTGLIGKRGDRHTYRMNAVVATIGIRGTDFVARLCEDDCASDQLVARQRKLKPLSIPIVARVAMLVGQMYATTVGGVKRPLNVGSPIQEGERVETDAESHGALLFTDGGRLVLAKGTHLVVSTYRFAAAQPDSSIVLDVLKGGVRFATGLLAKLRPEQVKVNTVTSVIGIRGTDFDLACAPRNTEPAKIDPMILIGEPCDGAIAVRMREGAVAIGEGTSEVLISAGETGYVPAPGQVGRKLSAEDDAQDDWKLPLPTDVSNDFNGLAGPDGREQALPGLYVLVKEGRVVILQDGKETELDPGETGFLGLDSDAVIKLSTPPFFLEADSAMREMDLDPMMCRAP